MYCFANQLAFYTSDTLLAPVDIATPLTLLITVMICLSHLSQIFPCSHSFRACFALVTDSSPLPLKSFFNGLLVFCKDMESSATHRCSELLNYLSIQSSPLICSIVMYILCITQCRSQFVAYCLNCNRQTLSADTMTRKRNYT